MKQSYLSRVNSPEDVKKLNKRELTALCDEIRDFLIRSVSKTGGHLASNLGVVELTVALHRVFRSPKDQIFWDVGHQAYTHKILTGRKDAFDKLRKQDGLSGYPKPHESVHDCFVAGHSSTSISAAFGVAMANRMKGDPHTAIAVIGDGSLTGGEAYEALNNAGKSGARLIVVLNHNEMSISKNVGAFAGYLSRLRSGRMYNEIKKDVDDRLSRGSNVSKATADLLWRTKHSIKSFIYSDTIFEDMGFTYLGPIDGHDLPLLCDVLKKAKDLAKPVVVHVCTKKGKGYAPAEDEPSLYHGVSKFNFWQGDCNVDENNFSCETGRILCDFAQKKKDLVAITAAMTDGTGLTHFAKQYPKRFFDVGIAEQHAVTFAGGLAAGGFLPVFAVYSSFLQRGFDQLLNDCARAKLRMVLCIDRAGFVGADGETHQGLFDVALLTTVPNLTLLAPIDYSDLRTCLHRAVFTLDSVAAVRYPRGDQPVYTIQKPLHSGDVGYRYYAGEQKEKRLIVSYGRMFANCANAAKEGIDLLRLVQLSPIPERVMELISGYDEVYFVEEGVKAGGVGEHIAARLLEKDHKGTFRLRAVENGYVPQGSAEAQMALCGMSSEQIEDWLKKR